MWWIKTRRAQSVNDCETWTGNEVHPTLSRFDCGDVRTVVLVEVKAVLLRDRAGKPGGGKGPLLSEEISLTLLNHNEQIPFQAIPIQDGRDIEKHQNGLGVGEEADPMFTLDRSSPHAVAHVKAARAGNVADAEPWNEDDVSPDNGGDTRATVVSVYEPKSAFEENWAESEVKNALRAEASKSSHAVVAPTLSASNDPSQSPQFSEVTAQISAMVEVTSIVRRLTPTECERLQGFPDGWTAGQTDSQRYKQMGNAVTVNVAAWVGKAIMDAETFNQTDS